MMSRIVRVIVLSLVAGLVAVGTPTSASAESTGQYHYQCVTYGLSVMTFNMYKGEPIKDCANGYVYVRLNGVLIHVWPLNSVGELANHKFTRSDILCVVAAVGLYTAVISTGGIAGVISAGASAVGLATCKA